MSKFESWMRLVRLPNLLTAPGDVLAGFFLAGGVDGEFDGKRIACAIGASVALYASGVVLNDVFDRKIDAASRPQRPIPAREISVSEALFVFVVACLAARNLAVGAGGGIRSMPVAAVAVLFALIVLYDSPIRRRHPFAGIILMGACRAANVALGASLCPLACRFEAGGVPIGFHALPAYSGALAVFLYVTAFSELARHETEDEEAHRAPSLRLGAPFFAMLAGFIAVFGTLASALGGGDGAGAFERVFCPLAAFAAVLALLNAYMLWKSYPRYLQMPALVGRHIGNLMRLQAALVMLAGLANSQLAPSAAIAALALFIGASLFRSLARRYSPS